MSSLKYFLSLFLRRLPIFLLIAALVSAVSVVVATSLPPAYVSKTTLIVESPQIPDSMAASTVRISARELLQIIDKRLLTRPNLLDIARDLNVLKDQGDMNPDEIVQAMRARTEITTSGRRDAANFMYISFEARSPQIAAAVVNEFLNEIQKDDAAYRRAQAGQTMAFFEQEVERLSAELQSSGAKILEFKLANSDALPENLGFRQDERSQLQDRSEQISREIFTLSSQREQLIAIFNATGGVIPGNDEPRTAAERRLVQAQDELEEAKLVYSETNPRVKMLAARVDQMQAAVEAEQGRAGQDVEEQTGNSALDFQLAAVDSRVASLQAELIEVEEDIEVLSDSIGRTPANSIALGDLQRDYNNIQEQYNSAVESLSEASVGERIELLSRGQRITVIEQPAVPSGPTKPNRMLIAGGGTFVGIVLGFGVVVLSLLLNSAPRRPEDLIKKLDVWPIATLPYIRTRRELIVQRGLKLLLILAILICAPLAVWAVHTYYQPLDLIADRIMNKLGVRW